MGAWGMSGMNERDSQGQITRMNRMNWVQVGAGGWGRCPPEEGAGSAVEVGAGGWGRCPPKEGDGSAMEVGAGG